MTESLPVTTFRTIAASTHQKTSWFSERIIGNVLDSISLCGDLHLSLKATKRKGKLGCIIFYIQDTSKLDTSSGPNFQYALKFAGSFVEEHNAYFPSTKLEVVTISDTALYRRQDDKSWSSITANMVAVKYTDDTKLKFFRNSNYYLSGIADFIYNGFVVTLYPESSGAQ